MSGVSRQTLAAAVQFDGVGVGTGLFTFANLGLIARTTRVVLTSLSYVEIEGPPFPVATNVQFWAVRPGGIPTERMPLGDGESAVALLNVLGDARMRLCGIILPREPGDDGLHWNVEAITQNKTQTATVCVDFVLCPYPESHERGSPDK